MERRRREGARGGRERSPGTKKSSTPPNILSLRRIRCQQDSRCRLLGRAKSRREPRRTGLIPLNAGRERRIEFSEFERTRTRKRSDGHRLTRGVRNARRNDRVSRSARRGGAFEPRTHSSRPREQELRAFRRIPGGAGVRGCDDASRQHSRSR